MYLNAWTLSCNQYFDETITDTGIKSLLLINVVKCCFLYLSYYIYPFYRFALSIALIKSSAIDIYMSVHHLLAHHYPIMKQPMLIYFNINCIILY